MHSRALLAAVEITESRERLPCAIDGRVRVAFERGETRLADAQHAEVRRLRSRAQQTFRALDLLSSGVDRSLTQLDARRQQIGARERQCVVRGLEESDRAAYVLERLAGSALDGVQAGTRPVEPHAGV